MTADAPESPDLSPRVVRLLEDDAVGHMLVAATELGQELAIEQIEAFPDDGLLETMFVAALAELGVQTIDASLPAATVTAAATVVAGEFQVNLPGSEYARQLISECVGRMPEDAETQDLVLEVLIELAERTSETQFVAWAPDVVATLAADMMVGQEVAARLALWLAPQVGGAAS